MARGYHEWNRSFMTTEGRSKRTKTPNCRLITPAIDNRENHWDRMSLLRLRYHPTMRIPNDPFIPYPYTAMAPTFSVTKEGIAVHAPVGLGSLEIQVDGKYVYHLEYPFVGPEPAPPPQNLHFTTKQIAELSSVDPTISRVSITAVGTDQRQAEIEDYGQLCRGSRLIIQKSGNGPAAPIPTSTPGSKFKKTLDRISNKNKSDFEPVPTTPGGRGPGYGQIELIKGISLGQEKRENTWVTLLNSHQGRRPRLAKIEVSAAMAVYVFGFDCRLPIDC